MFMGRLLTISISSIKIAVREEIFFDDGRQVFFVAFDLALDETLIFVVLDWKNDVHVFYPSVSFLALIPEVAPGAKFYSAARASKRVMLERCSPKSLAASAAVLEPSRTVRMISCCWVHAELCRPAHLDAAIAGGFAYSDS
jgi:hypothetical protein